MIVVLSVAIGLILWVVLWSVDLSTGHDGGFLFLLVVLAAGTIKGVSSLLPGNRDRGETQPDAAPFT